MKYKFLCYIIYVRHYKECEQLINRKAVSICESFLNIYLTAFLLLLYIKYLM